MRINVFINFKVKIIILLVIALVISFFVYSIIIKFYVDSYLESGSDLGRGEKIFEFYNTKIDDSSNKIYYLGHSSMKEDIDANLIDNLNDSFKNYNLGNPASTPLREVIEINSIINSKPKAVVIGVGYMSFSNNWLFPYDQYALISKYADLKKNNELILIYNETYREFLGMNKFKLLMYKRKFIYPATNYKINLLRYKFLGAEKPYSYKNYNGDFKSEGILLQSNESYNPEFINLLRNKKSFYEYFVPSETNIEKYSFEFIIQRLLENDIKIIIVKIPLNPDLLKKISNESKNNFDTFLNGISRKYNITILDYTSSYSNFYFYDGHHLNINGKKTFSKNLGLAVMRIVGEV